MTTKDERVAFIDEAIAKAGGIIRFTKAMGVTHQGVYAWRKRGWVPPERAVAIESIFGIPRDKLMNPDLLRVLQRPIGSDLL